MWIKYPVLFLTFYFIALFQVSFFAHFSLFGIVPNFVFILFFLILFFSTAASISELNKNSKAFWGNLFCAVSAGFFIDLFYFPFFGTAIISLAVISILIKKIFISLRAQKDKYPMNYFFILFVGFFLFYEIVSALFVYSIPVGRIFVFKIIYNLSFALAGFYICKYLKKLYASNRKLKLFG